MVDDSGVGRGGEVLVRSFRYLVMSCDVIRVIWLRCQPSERAWIRQAWSRRQAQGCMGVGTGVGESGAEMEAGVWANGRRDGSGTCWM